MYSYFLMRKNKIKELVQLWHIFLLLQMIKQEWEVEESPKIEFVQTLHATIDHHQKEELPPFEQLQSANPILPPGKHHDKFDSKGLRHKFLQDREKLNKTTFPEVRNKNWLNKTHLSGNKNLGMGNIFEEEDEDQDHKQIQTFVNGAGEFRNILKGKELVYLRINNMNYNKIGINQVMFFASFFINSRKDSFLSKKIPIFQYLARICKDIQPIKNLTPNPVTFDSKFQSGNLFCALHHPDETIPTYELYMQNDTNTKGCTQWFFFSICSQKRIKLRLRVMNFYKTTSLYMKGMKVLVSSSASEPNSKSEWKRIGTAIQYKRVILGQGRQSYALQFMYEIESPHQKYYFSYGYPYQYSHMEEFLNRISVDMPLFKKIAEKTTICKSYLGNNIHFLTITDQIKNKTPSNLSKPIIYIIGRQHPGETPSSYIIEGVLRTLLSNRLEMDRLRETFIIKVVPMINVDGVVCGNYRSNFSGNDVNRQWTYPSKKMHPELYYLKQEILSNKKNAHFFLDIHAHSRKMNSFFYGSRPANIEGRLYPFICSKLNKHISFFESSFVDDPSKKTTARVVLETEAGMKKSLTFQASFYGYEDEGKKIRAHFKMEDFRSIGQSLALAFFYSQIGIQKASDGEKQKQIEINSHRANSTVKLVNEKPKKKTQMELKVLKNIQKINEKWNKEIERFKKQDDIISEGSSLDPEHFQLQNQEEDNLETLQEHLSNLKRRKNQEGIKKQRGQYEEGSENQLGDVLVVEQKARSLKKVELKSKKEKEQAEMFYGNPEGQSDIEEKSTKVSFFPFQSNLRNTHLVKKLQSQLQIQKKNRRYEKAESIRRLSQQKGNQLKNSIIKGQRFKSIEVQKSEPAPNYRNNIIEMKKALKYFIENKTYNYKSADYDDYKNFMKYSTNGNSLVLADRDSIARIKKKYTRI